MQTPRLVQIALLIVDTCLLYILLQERQSELCTHAVSAISDRSAVRCEESGKAEQSIFWVDGQGH